MIKRGMHPDRLAKALNVNASTIVRKATLLEDIALLTRTRFFSGIGVAATAGPPMQRIRQ